MYKGLELTVEGLLLGTWLNNGLPDVVGGCCFFKDFGTTDNGMASRGSSSSSSGGRMDDFVRVEDMDELEEDGPEE